MRKVITLLIMLNPLIVMTQSIDFYPEKGAGVNDKDYQYGIMVLKETYDKVKEEGGVFNYADYWNLAVAYFALKQDPEDFRMLLYKSKELDSAMFAEIFLNPKFGGEDASKWEGYLTEEEYQMLISELRAFRAENNASVGINKPQTGNQNAAKRPLISIFEMINQNDNKFRKFPNRDMDKQKELDKQNLSLIDSLYNIHKKYIGASLVGNKYAHVMWSVIQHSNLKSMEKYLPVVFRAVVEEGLDETLLKMLIDRIYLIKCDYQIYGTQVGVPIGPKEEIAEIRANYEVCSVINDPSKKANKLITKKRATTATTKEKNQGKRLIMKPWKD